jgi:hypothetical protein
MSTSKWLAATSHGAKVGALSALDEAQRIGAFRRQQSSVNADSLGDVSGWQSGDASLYTAEMLDARVALRYDVGVRHELRRWTRALEAHSRAFGHKYLLAVPKELYTEAFRKVTLAMTKRMSKEKVEAVVEEDWELDSRGTGRQTLEQFKDSLFEVRAPASSHPTARPALAPPAAPPHARQHG